MRSDEDLVRDAGSGDSTAWNELVERYAQLVFANARAVGADVALAQDVSQLVWMRLLNRLDTIRDPGKVKGWLAIVARNATRDELRRRRPTTRVDDLFALEDDRAVDPAEAAGRADDAAVVQRALTQISDRCRQLLTLLFSAAMNYDEVSAAMDMPIGSIGPTRRRCLDSLSRHIPEELHET